MFKEFLLLLAVGVAIYIITTKEDESESKTSKK
jgi:hypothetical protein